MRLAGDADTMSPRRPLTEESTMQDFMTLRWTVLLTRGLIGIAFGVLAMAWPEETVTVLVVLWGCWALVDGIVMLLGIRVVPGTAPKVVALIAGLVALFIAFFAIARPGIAAATITWFIGIWLVVRGVLEIVEAFSTVASSGRWALVAGGLLDLFIGVLFMLNPGSAVLGIAWLLGLLALLWGCAAVGLAFFVRKATPPAGADSATHRSAV
jgi:uncharacterized membrane protein HdeD (DUF308 family)